MPNISNKVRMIIKENQISNKKNESSSDIVRQNKV